MLKKLTHIFFLELKDYYRLRKSLGSFRKLSNITSLKIEFGASGKKSGWITIGLDRKSDIVYDITKHIPISDETVEEIYSSHLLEHLSYVEIISFLKETYRILKVGACIKICVPDASIYFDLAFKPNSFLTYLPEEQRDNCKSFSELLEKRIHGFKNHSPLSIINYIAYMNGQHKYMFNKQELISILKHSGYQVVEERDYEPGIDLTERKWESIHLKAIK